MVQVNTILVYLGVARKNLRKRKKQIERDAFGALMALGVSAILDGIFQIQIEPAPEQKKLQQIEEPFTDYV